MRVTWYTMEPTAGATWDEYYGYSKRERHDHVGDVVGYVSSDGNPYAVIRIESSLVTTPLSELTIVDEKF